MNKVIRPKSISKIIILAIVLFVPGFLYLAMENLGTHEYVKLPVYGEKKLSGEMRRVMGRERPDTIFHTLSPLTFTNWDDKQVSFLDNDTTVSIAHLFYTKDAAFSKIALDYMDKLATKFGSKSGVHFYSISVDPSDHASALAPIAKQYENMEARQWYIVGNSSSDILHYAQQKMLLNAAKDTQDSARFLIDDQVILIDGKHRIRGFYPMSQHSEMKRLEDEIKVQLVEEVRDNPMRVEKK